LHYGASRWHACCWLTLKHPSPSLVGAVLCWVLFLGAVLCWVLFLGAVLGAFSGCCAGCCDGTPG